MMVTMMHPRRTSSSTKNEECFICGKKGHGAKKCPEKKKKSDDDSSVSSKSSKKSI